MRTHFTFSSEDEDAVNELCGTRIGNESSAARDWRSVDCLRCLKNKSKIILRAKSDERAMIEQMGDMAIFMKRNQEASQ
jgi:hypothetical protein